LKQSARNAALSHAAATSTACAFLEEYLQARKKPKNPKLSGEDDDDPD
jgi:hypothetical protein